MIRRGLFGVVVLVLASGCASERVAHGRWASEANDGPVSGGAIAPTETSAPASVTTQVETDQMPMREPDASAFEVTADIPHQEEKTAHQPDVLATYFDAEQSAHRELRARALATVKALVIEHEQRIPIVAQGPELQWHPALGVVSARQRTIRYDMTALTMQIRTTGDAERPFIIDVMVPCLIYGRSGKGVTFQGEPPQAQTSAIGELPLPTRQTDVTAVPPALRSSVDAAFASCASAESVSETVQAGVTLAYERSKDAVVLVHRREETAATGDQ